MPVLQLREDGTFMCDSLVVDWARSAVPHAQTLASDRDRLAALGWYNHPACWEEGGFYRVLIPGRLWETIPSMYGDRYLVLISDEEFRQLQADQ